jgi:hypothetical protein
MTVAASNHLRRMDERIRRIERIDSLRAVVSSRAPARDLVDRHRSQSVPATISTQAGRHYATQKAQSAQTTQKTATAIAFLSAFSECSARSALG